MSVKINETGNKYGHVIVLRQASSNNNGRALWQCQCDCGNIFITLGKTLRSGGTLSCGCSRGESHRLKDHPLYRIWCAIKTRCYNPNPKQFKDYGGRGISVCDLWMNSFKAFYDFSTSNGWGKGLQINRIDNNKNYEPSNVNFVTPTENCNNKRNNVWITFKNKTQTIAQWARELKLDPKRIQYKLSRQIPIKDILKV